MSGEALPGAAAPTEDVTKTPAADAAPGPEATAATNTEKPDEPEKTSPERTFTQKELDAIVQREKATERRRAERVARAEAEAKILREQNESLRNGEREREDRRGAGEDRAPDPKDFKDYDSYNRAVVRFEARQEIRQEAERREKAEKAQREQSTDREQFERDRAVLMKGAKEFRDFEEVVFDEEAPITRAMMRAALESDIPSKVAYYLAHPDHREEAMEIAELSPTRAAAKVHELAVRLTKAPKPNPLPDPIKPTGDTASASVDPDRLPMDQWLKWRNAQPDLKRRARRP